jgi:signal transduction histidine kinase
MDLRADARRAKAWARRNASTLRLGGSYLLIIMAMSLAFSFVFYHDASREVGRQLPPDSFFGQIPDVGYQGYHQFFANRIREARGDLLDKLVVVNLLALLVGGLFSWWLARWTLTPIERAMEAQGRFASDASHELRTPLAALQSENEVALRNPKLSLPRAKEVLQSNLEEVVRLRALSETLLRLAHNDVIDTAPVPVALSEVVSDAINACLKAAQDKEITIDDDIPKITVLADAAGLTQALSVLLDNAIKYSDSAKTVRLTATRHDKEAWLSVADEGIGIAAKDLPYVFERFYRADSSRTKQHADGHGLGLPLAAQIVHQFDGEITASSTIGKGSTFTIKLPLA